MKSQRMSGSKHLDITLLVNNQTSLWWSWFHHRLINRAILVPEWIGRHPQPPGSYVRCNVAEPQWNQAYQFTQPFFWNNSNMTTWPPSFMISCFSFLTTQAVGCFSGCGCPWCTKHVNIRSQPTWIGSSISIRISPGPLWTLFWAIWEEKVMDDLRSLEVLGM